MPIHAARWAAFEGLHTVPGSATLVYAVKWYLPWLVLLYILKRYFQGASNLSERNMHGKVVMITVCYCSRPPGLVLIRGREVHQELEANLLENFQSEERN